MTRTAFATQLLAGLYIATAGTRRRIWWLYCKAHR